MDCIMTYDEKMSMNRREKLNMILDAIGTGRWMTTSEVVVAVHHYSTSSVLKYLAILKRYGNVEKGFSFKKGSVIWRGVDGR